MRGVRRPVDVRVQPATISDLEFDIVIYSNIGLQGSGIVSIPSFGEHFCLAGLKALVIVVADFWLADWLESNGNGLGHFSE